MVGYKTLCEDTELNKMRKNQYLFLVHFLALHNVILILKTHDFSRELTKDCVLADF